MPDSALDYLVIGAGPAGLQLGYFLEQAGRSYSILEAASAPGAFFGTFPRHRRLISINKRHNGTEDPELNLRMDWNSLLSDDPDLLFTRYSDRYFPHADDMVRYLADFASAWRLRISYGTRAVRVTRERSGGPGGDRFLVTDQDGRVHAARRLVVATGVGQRANVPPIPGIEEADLYADASTDPADYVDQRVLVIGKGNSAFETADNLVETAAVVHVAGPRSLRMAWRTHFVGHLRAVNNNFLDTYQLKSLNAVLDGDVRRVERRADGGYLVTVGFVRANEVTKDIPYDRVIVCTGFRIDDSVFADGDCRPELTIGDRFPALTPAFESVNVPGLYFAGTLTQSRDFKRGTNGFIHGFRYGVRALHRILETRHHGAAWPGQDLPADPDVLAAAVLARVNRSSGLWQQFGVLADAVVLDGRGGARYLEELPAGLEGPPIGRPGARGHFTVALEYGPDHDAHDPFDVSVGRIAQSDAGRADEGHYLHPVVRYHREGAPPAVHHVTENLENDWTSQEVHVRPLRDFFAEHLAPARV